MSSKSELSANNITFNSVTIKTAISNRPDGEKPSIYARLCRYKKTKGVSDQDVIRFALAMFLDKVDGINI